MIPRVRRRYWLLYPLWIAICAALFFAVRGAEDPSRRHDRILSDEAAVRAAAQARANVQVELEVARARMMSQIFAVLTAEQKAQLAAKRQQFEQRRSEGPPREDVPNN